MTSSILVEQRYDTLQPTHVQSEPGEFNNGQKCKCMQMSHNSRTNCQVHDTILYIMGLYCNYCSEIPQIFLAATPILPQRLTRNTSIYNGCRPTQSTLMFCLTLHQLV